MRLTQTTKKPSQEGKVSKINYTSINCKLKMVWEIWDGTKQIHLIDQQKFLLQKNNPEQIQQDPPVPIQKVGGYILVASRPGS